MSRLIRVLAAGAALVALMVGIPFVLVKMAGWPLPTKMPDVSNAMRMIQQGNIEATTIVKVLACVVWAAWLVVAWAVVWEVVVNVPRLFKGRERAAAPAPMAPAPISKGIGWLFAILLATTAVSQTAAAAPSLGSLADSDDLASTELIVDTPAVTSHASASSYQGPTVFDDYDADPSETWIAQDGDTLWSISQASGSSIEEVMAVNPTLDAATMIEQGQRVMLPEGAAVPNDRRAPADVQTVDLAPAVVEAPAVGVATYVVQNNDGWRNVSAALLGDEERFVEMQQLAIGQEVEPGVVFDAQMAVIHPGWVFTAEAPATPAVSNNAVVHVVVEGESLSSIAGDHFGDDDRWGELWELNGERTMQDGRVFDDPNLIMPGWVLDVSPPTSIVEAPPVAPPAPAAETEIELPAPVVDAPIAAETVGDVAPESVETDPVVEASAPDVAVADDVAESTPTDAIDTGEWPPTWSNAGPDAAGVTPSTADWAAPTPAVDQAVPVSSQTEAGLGSVRDVRPVWMLGITGATALATALWALVRARRRRTAARGGGRFRATDASSMMVDEALRAAADPDLIDWANRSLGDLVAEHGLNETAAIPVVVELSRALGLKVQWEPPHSNAVPDGWSVDGAVWSLPFDPDHTEYGVVPVAIPGLVTIGAANGGHVLVDLESCGSLAVTGDLGNAEALVRSMVMELGAGGSLSNAYVHTVGLDIDGTEHLQRVHVRTEADAIEHLRSIRVQHDDVLNQANRSSMLEVRAAASPIGREVTVLAVRASSCVRLDELIEAAAPQRGVAVVVVGDAACAATLNVDHDGTATLQPLGLVIGAAGLSRQAASTLAVHLDQLNDALQSDTPSVPNAVESPGSDPWMEPTRLVRVIGVPEVDGLEELGRNELELLAFVASSGGSATDDEIADGMSCGRLTRSDVWAMVGAIRAEVGELLAARVEGGNTIALSTGCMSDVDWMSRLAFRSHTLDDVDAADDLIDALELVRGVPFDAPAGFDWVTTTGAFGRALEMIERTGYLLAARAIDAGMVTEACTALREVIEHVGPNEPLTQALMRLEQASGNTEGAESAYGDFTQELAFLSEGPEPVLPASGTTALLSRQIEVAELKLDLEPTVIDDSFEIVRETVRPHIVLRTFGEVCAEGASRTQALAAAFAVAAAQRPMSNEDVAEVTGYKAGSLSTVFTTAHEILERCDGELRLRDGVWTDHAWLAECARRAHAADEAGDVADVNEWLHTLFAEVSRVDGGAFAKPPGKKAYWSWVDDYPESLSARATAENEMVEAVLSGIAVWTSAEASEQIPADVVVRAACNLASMVPYAAVAQSLRPNGSYSGAECLIRAAHGAASGRTELVHIVISNAQKLVADGKIEASDEFADALGL
jgi:LysM repeat protein